MERTPTINTTDLPAPLLGRHTGKWRRTFPPKRRSTRLPGRRGFSSRPNLLRTRFPFGIHAGGPADGKARLSRHLGPAHEEGVVTNRNKFILGPSRAAERVFTTILSDSINKVRISCLDTGNSYKGLCDLIHQKTGGMTGFYLFHLRKMIRFRFNPFFTQDYQYDIEKRTASRRRFWPFEKGGRTARRSGRGGARMRQPLYREDKKPIKPNFNRSMTLWKGLPQDTGRQERAGEGFLWTVFWTYWNPIIRTGEYGYLLNSDKNRIWTNGLSYSSWMLWRIIHPSSGCHHYHGDVHQ